MTDPTAARSKAEASLRLAELAKTPRARDLFIKLAQDYEARARGELIEEGEAAPPLAPEVSDLAVDAPLAPDAPIEPATPLSDSDRWLAGLKAIREATSRD